VQGLGLRDLAGKSPYPDFWRGASVQRFGVAAEGCGRDIAERAPAAVSCNAARLIRSRALSLPVDYDWGKEVIAFFQAHPMP
jgi:hypothetical protein